MDDKTFDEATARHVNKNLTFLFLIMFTTACSSIETNSSNDVIPKADINRINEIYRIQSAAAKEVWPGFENAKFRFVMIGDENQWAINVDPLPEYYNKVAVPSSFNREV